MINITYTLRSDIVTDEEDNDYIVYGINALNENGELVKSIPDVFFSKLKAKDFVSYCNNKEIELNQLDDMAEKQLD